MISPNKEQIKRSDEILWNASKENRSLTKSERYELREAYVWEKQEESRNSYRLKQTAENFKEEIIILPRHIMQGRCASFIECPLDFKCRNYDPKYIKCLNCSLHETDGICHKRELHNEKNIAMMITRPRLEIESDKDGES